MTTRISQTKKNTNQIEAIRKVVFGNGEEGLCEMMRVVLREIAHIKDEIAELKDLAGPTRSDMKEALTELRAIRGQEHNQEPLVRYTAEDHPARRVGDKENSAADRVLSYFVDKILPSVIVWAILGLAAFLFAVNSKLIEL